MEQLEFQAHVRDVLSEVEHPTYRKSLLDLEMLDRVEIHGDDGDIYLKSPDEAKEHLVGLEARIRRKLKELPLEGSLRIHFIYDQDLAREIRGRRLEHIKNIILVGSGKGGVGKSTVSANLAAALNAAGKKVGIMDSDVYGPSMGKMFGMNGPVQLKITKKDVIYPVNVDGIEVMSFSFLLEQDAAVIWRGALLNNAVEQLLFEVAWSELDYLIVDLPPGTGDVQLSLSQLAAVTGAIVVSTPQSVAIQDAVRAVSMFKKVGINVLGLIENMSEFVCSTCGTVHHIFAKDGGKKMALDLDIPYLGSLPLETSIMEAGESGKPIVMVQPDGVAAKSMAHVVEKMEEQIGRLA